MEPESVAQELGVTRPEAEPNELTITKGLRLEGPRYEVSLAATKAGRAGTCYDCGRIVSLLNAREVCLDWDGVDAYHFYCPNCFSGTDGENYYKGKLIGTDGSQVIDQHPWYYQ